MSGKLRQVTVDTASDGRLAALIDDGDGRFVTIKASRNWAGTLEIRVYDPADEYSLIDANVFVSGAEV